ncbi:PspC domain-containing protein [Thermoactinospora rubra]|uniref:PspC domain-containing protein n=1 Tax=Thermoactinospora rubra TaxID=1088767 RepID=UPI000A10AD5D|nr:PspC domain-containing protein [Thermoactinospora rubra]
MSEAPPGRTDQAPPPPAPPRPLARSGEGRILTGVCAGMGRYTGIDPVVFRLAFAVLVVASGVGVYLYVAAWLLMKAPSGGPGYVEQWTRRDFDGQTVMALLTAVLGFGLTVNLATVWVGTGTLVVATLLAVALLTAHARGVDLLGLARSMPERLNRRRTADLPHVAPPAPRFDGFPPPRAEPADVPPTTQVRTPEAPGGRPDAAQAADAPRVPDAPQVPEPRTEIFEPAGHRAETSAPETEPKTEAFEPVAPEPQMPEPQAPEPHTEVFEAPEGPPPSVPRLPYGEPFAPHGPYRPLDPRKRSGYGAPEPYEQPYEQPYEHSPYGYPGPYEPLPHPAPSRRGRAAAPRRPRSFIGAITTLLALIMGGIVVAVQSTSGTGPSLTAVGGAMLVTIGAGLLVAAWWGRGAGLVALGTVVAVAASLGLLFRGLPTKISDVTWQPTSAAEAREEYAVGIGEGLLDLTGLKLEPGSTVTVRASVSVGELVVEVPPTVALEVHATNKVGDIKVGHWLSGGTGVEVDKVFPPEVPPEGAPATIVLHIRGGVGDVEVKRAA